MKTRGRRIGMGAVMLIFGLIPANLFAGTVWSTGFEGGLPTEAAASGNWRVVTSAPAAHSGTKGLDISGATTLVGRRRFGSVGVVAERRGELGTSDGFLRSGRGRLVSESIFVAVRRRRQSESKLSSGGHARNFRRPNDL